MLYLFLLPAYAAVNFFLEVDGIPGESTDSNHSGWIEADGFSHNIQNEDGTVQHDNFIVYVNFDKSTPLLNLQASDEQIISTVIMEMVDGSDSSKLYYRVTLWDATVTLVSVTGADSGDWPTQIVSFDYGRIQWEYQEYDAGGSPTVLHLQCWNVTNQTTCSP
jgi:type VI secretion system secreted protein Hcp